jgi:hypothetical protein
MDMNRPIRSIIRATDKDAMHYTVRDGHGNFVNNVTVVDTDANLVTVFACDSRGKFRVDDHSNRVTVTYRPPGGVVVTDDRNEEALQ